MINFAQVLGRVGKMDCKTLNNNLKVANISIVTAKKYMKDGQKVEKTTWHNVSFYSKLAEIAEKYVSVGDLLYIQGEMDTQKYTGQDGVERTKFCIIGHEIKLMPKSKEHKPEPQKGTNYTPEFDDDPIPF